MKNASNIGLVVLSCDPTTEQDFRSALDCNIYVNRIPFVSPVTEENLQAMQQHLTDVVSLIVPEEPLDAVVYSCTSGSMLIGNDVVAELIHSVRPEVQVITPSASALNGLEDVYAKRIGLVTPYIESVHNEVVDWFEGNGISVINSVHLNCTSDYEISRVSSATITQSAIDVSTDVDAVFLSCTALPAYNIAGDIESKVEMPVLTSNQQMIWDLRRMLNET